MIITVYKNTHGIITGFKIDDHAQTPELCAAISAITEVFEIIFENIRGIEYKIEKAGTKGGNVSKTFSFREKAMPFIGCDDFANVFELVLRQFIATANVTDPVHKGEYHIVTEIH